MATGPSTKTIPAEDVPWEKRQRFEQDRLALVIVWSLEEPARVGDVALVTGESILGRGPANADDPARRLTFLRQRPGSNETQGPLGGEEVHRQARRHHHR